MQQPPEQTIGEINWNLLDDHPQSAITGFDERSGTSATLGLEADALAVQSLAYPQVLIGDNSMLDRLHQFAEQYIKQQQLPLTRSSQAWVSGVFYDTPNGSSESAARSFLDNQLRALQGVLNDVAPYGHAIRIHSVSKMAGVQPDLAFGVRLPSSGRDKECVNFEIKKASFLKWTVAPKLLAAGVYTEQGTPIQWDNAWSEDPVWSMLLKVCSSIDYSGHRLVLRLCFRLQWP